MRSLSKAMKVLVDGIRLSTDARQAGLQHTRKNTRQVLARNGRGRRDMARATRQNVQEQVNEIREAVGEMRQLTREFLGEVASDVRAATQLWRRGPQPARPVLHAPAATPPPAPPRKTPACGPEGEDRSPVEPEQLLRVIRAHLEGIRLVDIGNELGVDWRGLIGLTRTLLDGGRIDKIENLYYPSES